MKAGAYSEQLNNTLQNTPISRYCRIQVRRRGCCTLSTLLNQYYRGSRVLCVVKYCIVSKAAALPSRRAAAASRCRCENAVGTSTNMSGGDIIEMQRTHDRPSAL